MELKTSNQLSDEICKIAGELHRISKIVDGMYKEIQMGFDLPEGVRRKGGVGSISNSE